MINYILLAITVICTIANICITVQDRGYRAGYDQGLEDGIRMTNETASEDDRSYSWRHYEGMIYCEKCGAEFYGSIMDECGDDYPKYCPECGARMFEEEVK